jgi:hypothetical protein
MATKADAVAAKKRQQKIILAVGGVILAGLLVLQGPKLFKHHGGSSSSAAPSTATTTPTTGTTAPTGGSTTPALATGGASATLAGVILRPAGAAPAGTGQLWSLSRFPVKDPFVQQVKTSTSTGGATGAATGATGATKPSGGARGGALGTVTPTTSTPSVLAYATLMVNGRPLQLVWKDVFPKGQPTFVLLGVDKNFVKIGVAGGKFTDGDTVKLELGKRVTLLNTATGARFVMKLVYTGVQPEQIAVFKAPAVAAAAAAAGASKQSASTKAP